MKTRQLTMMLALLTTLGLLASACNADIERNSDGSLKVETTMTGAAIQAEIEAALADPLIQELVVDLCEGYILVTGKRSRASGDATDTMSFRLDLDASGGHLSATISEARIDGLVIEEGRVAKWNERIAIRLTRLGQRNPDSSLEAVTISDEAVTMIWRVETRRSDSD